MSEPEGRGAPAADEATTEEPPPEAQVVSMSRLEPWQRWLGLAVALTVLYAARTVLAPFVIAGILAYIFTGAVSAVQARLRLPRLLVAGVLYLIVLAGLGTAIYSGAREVVIQTAELQRQGPSLVESALRQIVGAGTIDFFGASLDAHQLAQRIETATQELTGSPGTALHYGELIVTRLLDIFLVVIVSFYLIVDGHKLGAYLLKFVPDDNRPAAGYIAGRVHSVLGAYLRGQLLLIGLMATVTWLALQFGFGLRYALPLAIATGILEIIPLIGPAIAAAAAAVVALAQGGPGPAIGVLILYLILRETEDQLVMPFVVGRAVDLHPVVTIFAVLVGGALAGFIGILLAVPAAAAIKVMLDILYPGRPERALVQARRGLRQAAQEEQEGE